MRMIGRWYFEQDELDWLADQALTNNLAADVLVRYYRRYSHKKNLNRRVKEAVERLSARKQTV